MKAYLTSEMCIAGKPAGWSVGLLFTFGTHLAESAVADLILNRAQLHLDDSPEWHDAFNTLAEARARVSGGAK